MKPKTTRRRKGDVGASVYAYQLGLDRKGTEYDWAGALRVAARETGSNALRCELEVLHWGPDGQQRPAVSVDPPSDVRGAIRVAEALVLGGDTLAEVRGTARRLFAQRGFGDRVVFEIATVEPG